MGSERFAKNLEEETTPKARKILDDFFKMYGKYDFQITINGPGKKDSVEIGLGGYIKEGRRTSELLGVSPEQNKKIVMKFYGIEDVAKFLKELSDKLNQAQGFQTPRTGKIGETFKWFKITRIEFDNSTLELEITPILLKRTESETKYPIASKKI